MGWLDDLAPEEVRHWISHTSIPMMASLPDGKILWCNQAYENLTGYTSYELVRMDWRTMTDGVDDLNAEDAASKEIELGHRKDYKITKLMRTKNSPSKRVILHVMRNPFEGAFKACFVSVYPIDGGYEFTLATLQDMQKQQLKIFEMLSNPRPTWLNQYIESFRKYPYPTTFATIFILAFIFGNRILEIVGAVRDTMQGIPFPPSGAP